MGDVRVPDEMLTAEVGVSTEKPTFVDKVINAAPTVPDELLNVDVSEDYKAVANLDEETRYIKSQAHTLDGFAQYLADQWQIGKQDVPEGVAYSKSLAFGAEDDYEAVTAQFSAARKNVEAMEKRVSIFESEMFINTEQYRGGIPWIGRAIQEIPGVVARNSSVGHAAIMGGVATAAVTTPIAAGAGAIMAGPAAPVGAAVGAAVGAGLGFTSGVFTTSAFILGGLAYRDLRKLEITHKTAQVLAIASGIFQAVIENLQIHQLKDILKGSFKKTVKTPEFKIAVEGVVARTLRDVSVQGIEEGAQEVGQISAEVIGVLVDLKRLPTTKEWLASAARVGQAVKGGVQGGHGNIAIAKGLGIIGGGVARLLTDKGGDQKVADGITAIKEDLQDQHKVEPIKIPDTLKGNVETTVTKPAEPQESESVQVAKESLDNAKEIRIKANQHLETVEYEIDQIAPGADGNVNVPKGLIEKRKDANKALREARHREKKAKLGLAKAEAQDVVRSKDSTPAQVEAARAQVDKLQAQREAVDETFTKEKKDLVRRDLTGQIELLKKEFQAASLDDADNVQNISKELHNAEMRLMLLDSGFLSAKLESELISSERDKVIRRGVAELAFKAFESVWQTMKASTNIAKEQGLKDRKLIHTLIKESGLDKADQASFMNYLKTGYISQDRLAKLENRIGALRETRAKQKANARIKDALTLAGKPKTKVRSETPLTPKEFSQRVLAQSILNAYRKLFKMKDKDLKAFVSALETDPINDIDASQEPGHLSNAIQNIIANDVLKAREGDSTVKNAVAERIEKIIETDKDEHTQRVETERQERIRREGVVTQGVQGDVGVKRSRLKSLNTIMEFLTKWKRIGITQGWFNTHTADVATILQHTSDTDHEAYDLLDISKEDRARAANTISFTNAMFNMVTDNGKGKRDKKLVDTIIRGAKQQKRAGFREKISDNELIKVWMQTFDDEGVQTGLKNTYRKSGEALREIVEQHLSDDQIKMAERLQQFYQDIYERYNRKHIELYGTTLSKVKFYSGFASRIGANGDALTPTFNDFINNMREHQSISPASLKARQFNSKLKLRQVDAFSDAMNYVSGMESWHAMAKKAQDYSQYFAPESRISQIIINKFGERWLNRFKSSYKKRMGLERIPAKLPYIDAVRGNLGMYVTGNPIQYAKQATGILLYLNYLNPGQLISGINDYIDNMEEANSILAKTDFMIQRHGNNTPEIAAIKSGLKNGLGKGSRLTDFLAAPVSQTDFAVNSAGMWAMYVAGGKTAEAMQAAERAADESQSSGLAHQKTSLEVETGSFGQLLGTLSKQNTQVSNLESAAWRRAISNPNHKTIGKALQATIAMRSSQAAFGAVTGASAIIMAAQFGDDDGEDLAEAQYNAITDFIENLLGGGHIGLPVVGAFMKAAIINVENWKWDADKHVWGVSTPMADSLDDLSDLMRDFTKDATSSVPLDEIDYLRFWHAWNRSGATLMPPQMRAIGGTMVGLDPTIKTIAWLLTDPDIEKQKKKARRRGDTMSAPTPEEPDVAPWGSSEPTDSEEEQ